MYSPPILYILVFLQGQLCRKPILNNASYISHKLLKYKYKHKAIRPHILPLKITSFFPFIIQTYHDRFKPSDYSAPPDLCPFYFTTITFLCPTTHKPQSTTFDEALIKSRNTTPSPRSIPPSTEAQSPDLPSFPYLAPFLLQIRMWTALRGFGNLFPMAFQHSLPWTF